MIYIFATSVQSEKDIQNLRPYLDAKLCGAKWSFDLEDCDNIFRVDTTYLQSNFIIQLLSDVGYHCEELAY